MQSARVPRPLEETRTIDLVAVRVLQSRRTGSLHAFVLFGSAVSTTEIAKSSATQQHSQGSPNPHQHQAMMSEGTGAGLLRWTATHPLFCNAARGDAYGILDGQE